MAQVNDGFEVQNASFPSVRADMNATFLAIATQNAGVSEPTNPVAYMFWLDTSKPEPVLNMRDASNTGWIEIMKLVANGGLMPSGTIIEYAGTGTPEGGFLPCDGLVYQAADYPSLFSAVGSTYNTGSESPGEFRVPDRRKRVGIGATTGYPLGSTGGAETVTLTEQQMPSHGHGVVDDGHGHTVVDGGHGHGISDSGHQHDGDAILSILANRDIPGLTGGGQYDLITNFGTISNSQTGVTVQNNQTNITIQNGQSGVTVGSSGGGQPHPNMPPYLVCNYFIKF
ncbi:MAG: tail fiber protein [Cyanobacteria bacterium J06639_14]